MVLPTPTLYIYVGVGGFTYTYIIALCCWCRSLMNHRSFFRKRRYLNFAFLENNVSKFSVWNKAFRFGRRWSCGHAFLANDVSKFSVWRTAFYFGALWPHNYGHAFLGNDVSKFSVWRTALHFGGWSVVDQMLMLFATIQKVRNLKCIIFFIIFEKGSWQNAYGTKIIYGKCVTWFEGKNNLYYFQSSGFKVVIWLISVHTIGNYARRKCDSNNGGLVIFFSYVIYKMKNGM